MKKTILISAIAAICSFLYSADTLRIPFYQENINLPFSISKAECIEIIGKNPVIINENELGFDIPLNYKFGILESKLYLNFSNDHLINARLDFRKITDEETYKSTLNYLLYMMNTELGEFSNLYYNQYYFKENTIPIDAFPYLVNESDIWYHFDYYWDNFGLTYKMHGRGHSDYISINILIRYELSREMAGYKKLDRINSYIIENVKE